MVALEERFMIRELYRKGVSISEIARQTGRDRKTIRQTVNAPDLLPPKHSRQVKVCKIDPYALYLEQRMAEGVLNARKLYGEILAQGYPGKESKVREFVHERRPDKEPTGTVRFETAPGEQGQVDWGYFGFITHHGRTYRLYAFVMTLGWSRASYLRFTIAADTTWFIRCHLHAFTYLEAFPSGCSTITSKVSCCGVMLRMSCIGTHAFWTLRMWPDLLHKPANRTGLKRKAKLRTA